MEDILVKAFEYAGIPGIAGVIVIFIFKEMLKRRDARIKKEQNEIKEYQKALEKKNDEVKKEQNEIKEYQKALEKKNDEVKAAQEEATKQRGVNRDLQMKQQAMEYNARIDKIESRQNSFEDSFKKHIQNHQSFENHIMEKIDAVESNTINKIDSVYQRLNPIGDTVMRIEGYLEAQKYNVKATARGKGT
jgi:chromosome segregation ATPase